jgi:hypothetical protein
MQTFPIEYYVGRREECLVAAASTKLENARKRQLDAAQAWQQIIDRHEGKPSPLYV